LCPECGDKAALEETKEKQSRVGYVYNKGPEQYLGDPKTTKHLLKTAGSRKHLPTEESKEPRQSLAGSYIRPNNRKKWTFDHWEWYWNPKTLRREKRAVLKEVK